MARLWAIVSEHFLEDIFPLIPFHTIFNPIFSNHGHILYFTKVVRIFKGFHILNYKVLIQYLKDFQILRIQRRMHVMEKSAKFIKISDLVLLSSLLKTIKLIAIIVTLSFLTGIVWYIATSVNDQEIGFIEEFGLSQNSRLDNSILLTYFSFTTFSTVGLGDYHPKNNMERLMSAMIMLFGVMVTSFLIENFNQMLDLLKTFNDTYNDNQMLALFLGTMKKFNNEAPLRNSERINDYFKYRWSHDRNLAVSTDQDKDLLDQLPKRLQIKLYTKYLFEDFMELYKQIFEIKTVIYVKRMNFLRKYSQDIDQEANINYFDPDKIVTNDVYDDFLVQFLSHLEPYKFIEGGTILRQERVVDSVFFSLGS